MYCLQKTNAISSLRLFNRPGGFIHCVLMLVGLFFNLLNENTVVRKIRVIDSHSHALAHLANTRDLERIDK